MNRRSMQLDFSGITTCTAQNRHNLVRIDTLKTPGDPVNEWGSPEFDTLVERIKAAKEGKTKSEIVVEGLRYVLKEEIKEMNKKKGDEVE